MAIKIKKNGKIEQFTLHSTDVKVLDLEGKFKKKDLESVIREISDTEHIHIGEVDTSKNGIWLDDEEILDNSENNGVVERLKEYVDNKIELIKLVNVEVDFNELEDGRYLINTTKEYLKNAPNGVLRGGILTVNRCSEGLSQILISDEDRVYYRKKWYVYWSEWNELISANQISNPNLLINGDFQVWQRGTSFSTNGYTADRWMYDVEGDDKGKIVRHANGGVQIKLISNKRFWFMQRIELNQELKNIFSNSTVTLSFYVTTSAGVKISPYIRVWSPSRNANIFLKSYEAKATRQLIECQITLGDLSSDDWLGIDIFRIEEDNKFTVGDDLYIRFENAKFELGSKATPFVPRPYGEELALCQRYYYRWGNERARYRAVGINGNQLFFFVPLPTTLRIIPTINNAFSINTLSGAGVSDFTFAVNIVPMGMIVHATKSTHGMSDGQLMLSDDGSLDAEIY